MVVASVALTSHSRGAGQKWPAPQFNVGHHSFQPHEVPS
jgi:hypothetical protein